MLVMVMAAAMMVVGGGFVYYLLRSNPGGRPRGAVQWVAMGMATLLVVTSGLLLVLAAVVQSGGGTIAPATADPAETASLGEAAPSFPFRTVADDAPRRLDEFRGNVVLLNFWATWCAPCLKELPDLDKLQEDYEEEGLVVVALSDESPSTLRSFLAERPMETVTGYLPGDVRVPQPFASTMAIRPSTYIIDREGVVRDVVRGARSYSFFEQAVRPYL